ncbi:hypothetical protein ACOJIV_07645 [Haloarcula sp. AONF1]
MPDFDLPDNWSDLPMVVKTEDGHLYIDDEETIYEYPLGTRSEETHQQYQRVTQALENDQFRRYLHDAEQLHAEDDIPDVDEENQQLLDDVVLGIHDKGRGIAGICSVQLFIKSVEPRLSVRLHKGSNTPSNFSWVGGWSLRTLDDSLGEKAIGVELNERNLLLANTRGGSAMTRGLAEAEPYTPIYNPALEGPRESWLEVVERLENDDIEPEPSLLYFLKRLFDEREVIEEGVSEALAAVDLFNETGPSIEDVEQLVIQHMEQADRQAKLLEVAAHSLLQAVEDAGGLPGDLKRLEELTAANRRSGTSTRVAEDVGDVEIAYEDDEDSLLHTWDSKYVDVDRSELSSLAEKLENNPGVERAGFVTVEISRSREDTSDLEDEIDDEYGVEIEYVSLGEFREAYVDEANVSMEPIAWLEAYVETLGRERMDRALVRQSPVTWLESLVELVENETGESVAEKDSGEVSARDDSGQDEELQSGLNDFS